MILKSILSILSFIVVGTVAAQTNLPVKHWNASDQNPYVLYISGDGGFNEFSTGLCNAINHRGYAITALNAKTYFWNKKTPEQTTADVSTTIESQLAHRNNKNLVLIGYSFGADVMPFIVNRLSPALKARLLTVMLLSPSSSTDFEVHWSDFFGANKRRSMDVVSEMNKMQLQKTITIIGVEETHFPVKDIKLKNYTNENLPGGHDFDGNAEEVAKAVTKYFR